MKKDTNNTEKTFLEKNFTMTKQQILKLVREHFKPGGVCDDGSCTEYYGDPDAFVKFAQSIYEEAYQEGFDEGTYQESYNNSMRDLDILGIGNEP